MLRSHRPQEARAACCGKAPAQRRHVPSDHARPHAQQPAAAAAQAWIEPRPAAAAAQARRWSRAAVTPVPAL